MTSCRRVVFSATWHYHVQLPSLLRHAGDGHSGENGGGEGEVRVDGRSVLSIAVVCDGRVETGPVHPQEECTCRLTHLQSIKQV